MCMGLYYVPLAIASVILCAVKCHWLVGLECGLEITEHIKLKETSATSWGVCSLLGPVPLRPDEP